MSLYLSLGNRMLPKMLSGTTVPGAVADPTRRAILDVLAKGAWSA